jgi:hypothetical protein
MGGITIYNSDNHGNLRQVRAVRILANHLSERFGINLGYVDGGDFPSQDLGMAYVQQPEARAEVERVRGEQLLALNGEFGKMNCPKYAVLGNHDPNGTEKELSNLNFAKTADINGRRHAFVQRHASVNFYHPNEEKYDTLEKEFKQVEARVRGADVVVAHEIPHKTMGIQRHQGLEKIVNERGEKHPTLLFGGHVHENPGYQKLGKNLYGIRSCGLDESKALHLVVNYANKDVIYTLANKALYDWAASISPEEMKMKEEKHPLAELPPPVTFKDEKGNVFAGFRKDNKTEDIMQRALPALPPVINHRGVEYFVVPIKRQDEELQQAA